jgi:lysophospholipase L1-like esterase
VGTVATPHSGVSILETTAYRSAKGLFDERRHDPVTYGGLDSSVAKLIPLVGLVCASCAPVTPPPGGDPTPPPGTAVSGFVYYDEDRDGRASVEEAVRFSGLTLSIEGRSASTDAAGRFTVPGVPDGVRLLQASTDTLPAYFTAPVGVSINAPLLSDVAFPITLPLGPYSRRGVFVAFGDSITAGEGSSDGSGYTDWLQADLRATFLRADVLQDGHPGTRSVVGESLLGRSVNDLRPAYVLILYGTNDWNEAECRNSPPCYTVDSLRSMVGQVRAFGALPILGTIPPVNPLWVDRGATERNAWVRAMNDRIRAMARVERVSIAEVHNDLWSQPSVPAMFEDDKHPNDDGYRVIARSFYNAVTRPLQVGW